MVEQGKENFKNCFSKNIIIYSKCQVFLPTLIVQDWASVKSQNMQYILFISVDVLYLSLNCHPSLWISKFGATLTQNRCFCKLRRLSRFAEKPEMPFELGLPSHGWWLGIPHHSQVLCCYWSSDWCGENGRKGRVEGLLVVSQHTDVTPSTLWNHHNTLSGNAKDVLALLQKL